MTEASATGAGRPGCPVRVLDPELYKDPHAGYSKMRTEAPLSWDDEVPSWILSKHADVAEVSLHADQFCSRFGIRPRQAVDLSLVSLDGAEHIRQRRLINQGFSPRMIRLMEPRVREVVTETLDRIADRGECDFVADIAVPVPLVVIAELMGLPVEDRERLWHWSDRMMAGDGHLDPDDPVLADAAAAFGEYTTYVSDMIAERRAAYQAAKEAAGGEAPPPGDDLISVLVAAAEDDVLHSDEELTKDELMMFLVVVVIAGNETTRNAMSGGMLAFSQFPDEWRRLVAEPELMGSAVDEILRWVSPVISFARTATSETTLSGQTIAEGDKVLMLYQSANRDEDVFEDAGQFRIDRSPNPHLAFGIGPHVCLGINLAKLELRVLFEELARRFPDMAVVPGTTPEYGESSLVHSLETLPVTFTPEQTPAAV